MWLLGIFSLTLRLQAGIQQDMSVDLRWLGKGPVSIGVAGQQVSGMLSPGQSNSWLWALTIPGPGIRKRGWVASCPIGGHVNPKTG